VLRVLLVAPTVDGTDIGEAWVAYQWARRLSERHEVTVLTYRKRHKPSAVPQLPGARVVEWVEPPVLGAQERLNSLLKPAYAWFYRRARTWIRAGLAAGETFDVAHQPVPVAMRYPSPLRGLGIPYVMGPVGGGLDSPPGFGVEDKAPWYVSLRRFDHWRLAHDPWLRNSYEDAACVLAIAPYAAESLAGLAIRRMELLSETGLDSLPAARPRADASTGPVRLLFVGRVIRTKGVRDALRALALVPELDVQFDVVGDGYDRGPCEALSAELGLTERVHFHGTLPRSEVEAFYEAADVFFFPSFREPGGNVVFEAMGHGLAMLVCDRGGPGHVVDAASGFRVPARSASQYPAALAEALQALVADPDLRRSMGESARQAVATTGLWQHRIESAEAIYADIVRQHA
jgi:glycosyltransferase involved in cell wall biosynthesis